MDKNQTLNNEIIKAKKKRKRKKRKKKLDKFKSGLKTCCTCGCFRKDDKQPTQRHKQHVKPSQSSGSLHQQRQHQQQPTRHRRKKAKVVESNKNNTSTSYDDIPTSDSSRATAEMRHYKDETTSTNVLPEVRADDYQDDESELSLDHCPEPVTICTNVICEKATSSSSLECCVNKKQQQLKTTEVCQKSCCPCPRRCTRDAETQVFFKVKDRSSSNKCHCSKVSESKSSQSCLCKRQESFIAKCIRKYQHRNNNCCKLLAKPVVVPCPGSKRTTTHCTTCGHSIVDDK